MSNAKRSLQYRIVAAITVTLFVVAGIYSLVLSAVIFYTEEHLVSENLKESLNIVVEQNIPQGIVPDFGESMQIYAKTDPDHLGLKPIPEFLIDAPMGYSEFFEDDKAFFIYREPVNDNDFMIVRDQSEFEEKERLIQLAALLGVVISVSCGLVLGWILSRGIVNPIKRLGEEIQRSAQSPTFEPLKVHAEDKEIDTLAKFCESSIERLHSLVQQEKNYTSDLSHEIRTPLTVIRLNAELLGETELTPAQRRYADKIASASDQIQHLTTSLLNLAREDIKETNTVKPLEEIAKELVELLQSTNSFNGTALKIEGHSSVLWPEVATQTVMRNLILNAVTHSASAVITIKIGDTGFEIVDHGVGIPKEEIEKIFMPFFRGEHGNNKGVGLGLSIVKRICDKQQWQIQVSTQVGQGSTFSIRK